MELDRSQAGAAASRPEHAPGSLAPEPGGDHSFSRPWQSLIHRRYLSRCQRRAERVVEQRQVLIELGGRAHANEHVRHPRQRSHPRHAQVCAALPPEGAHQTVQRLQQPLRPALSTQAISQNPSNLTLQWAYGALRPLRPERPVINERSLQETGTCVYCHPPFHRLRDRYMYKHTQSLGNIPAGKYGGNCSPASNRGRSFQR